MVAEQVLTSLLPARVGVKRSRAQPNQPAAQQLEVRPALDADRRDRHHRPTMDEEGRGTLPATTKISTPTNPPTRNAPSLLPASSISRPTRPSHHARSPRIPTHEMFV